MGKFDLVVIGASAGGLEGLSAIVRDLTPSTKVALLVVMHTNAAGTTYLPQILGRISRAPVAMAKHGDKLRPGCVFIAPPDFHLLVTRRGLALSKGPRENGFRPAIDPLFRTAAQVYKHRVIGVILSGALDDGTYGMQMIKQLGGTTVVQDPAEAPIPSMPLSVLATVPVDHVVKAAAIPGLIGKTVLAEPGSEAVMTAKNALEPQDPRRTTDVDDMTERFGPPSGLTCPDCGGALWELAEQGLARYRCHVGHQYSPDALEMSHHTKVEAALWTAIRVLEEHADMKLRMADRAGDAGLNEVRKGFVRGAQDSHRHAEAVRQLLFSRREIEPGDALKATSPVVRVGRAKAKRSVRSQPRRA